MPPPSNAGPVCDPVWHGPSGNEVVHVIDVGVPSTPRVIFYTRLAGGELTDIETCADFVAVAFDNQQSPLHGMVYVFRGFDRRRGTMERLHSIRGEQRLQVTSWYIQNTRHPLSEK